MAACLPALFRLRSDSVLGSLRKSTEKVLACLAALFRLRSDSVLGSLRKSTGKVFTFSPTSRVSALSSNMAELPSGKSGQAGELISEKVVKRQSDQ